MLYPLHLKILLCIEIGRYKKGLQVDGGSYQDLE